MIEKSKKIPLKLIFLLIILGLFAAVFLMQLSGTSSHRQTLNKEIPEFSLPDLYTKEKISSTYIKQNAPLLINIWASWCAPCRSEHKFLKDLSQKHHFKIIGINYKDKRENGQEFISRYGNPYFKILNDSEGIETLKWGIRGVPETLIIDKNGLITFKHSGEITQENIHEIIQEFKKVQ